MNHNKISIYYLAILLIGAFQKIVSDPLYLNNTNPYPLFSSEPRYNHFSQKSKEEIASFIYPEKETEDKKKFHANFMPYIQYGQSGANAQGQSELISYINNKQSVTPINDVDLVKENIPQAGADAQNDSTSGANLVKMQPMPFGSIPEPFNYFALFYTQPEEAYEPLVYKTGELINLEYESINVPDSVSSDDFITAQTNYPVPSGEGYFNQVPKVVARYLGMADSPFILIDSSTAGDTTNDANTIGIAAPSPLMYDYSNYSNHFFGLLQYPSSRDPKKLFGYGYFNATFQKIGVRGTLSWDLNDDFYLKIYTGYSNLDISQIQVVDTTMGYQGPTGSLMFSRYPDQIYSISVSTAPEDVQPYVTPNLYQLTQYNKPIDDPSSNALFNNNYHNTSELKNVMPDQFKTSFLQNIQYNMDNFGALINQDFRPYSVQSFDDTTFELNYRKLFRYNNQRQSQTKENKKLDHIPYTFSPTASVHVTCPIAPRTPANKIFGRPLDNNGHWELGANVGLEFDFVNNISLGGDVGFSWYNDSEYENYPVPTNQLNAGIYLYNANLTRMPGNNYTAAIGMQVNEFYDCFDLFTEWRMVRHATDRFAISKINNLLPIKYLEDTHTSPDTEGSLSTIPNGILYLNHNQQPPYPKKVITSHLEEISSWSANFLNFTGNFKINEDMKLGFAWQQPFWLRNAYNTSTFGISFEMFI